VTGETVDNILEYLDFGFYDHVSFKENAGLGMTTIRRWLGVSHRVGGLLLYWVLTMPGTVISCTTVKRVTNLEKETDEVKAPVSEFDSKISCRVNEEENLAYDHLQQMQLQRTRLPRLMTKASVMYCLRRS
jgi:hypothetical protein